MRAEKHRMLFVGESWLGSCARSMREALARQTGVRMDDLNEDFYFPPYRSYSLRVANRLLARAREREFACALLERIAIFKPTYLVTYKGSHLDTVLLREVRGMGVKTINIYPDCSPHAHGYVHREAVGCYDVVISTKPFHPSAWATIYGYTNRCEFVPQGYDPLLHLEPEPAVHCAHDVTMIATWRHEYHDLLMRFAASVQGKGLKVAIAGSGWMERRADFPCDWTFGAAVQGRSYVDWLRNAKVCFAPITTDVLIRGQRQPGDVDSTRTYELAASHCFFIHRRTPYVETLYDEQNEVPFYDSPEELAEKILFYLRHETLRTTMANNAHRRAVPAYSNDQRARDIIKILE